MNEAEEVVGQIIHDYKHRAGTANICGECREVATSVVEAVFDAQLRVANALFGITGDE